MKVAYILPHLECYGGVRRALELCNRLLQKDHEVYFYIPSGKQCKWFDNKVPVRKLSEANQDKFDVVVFSLESQYEEPKKFKTKSVVYYILHYGILYKDKEVCKKSYQQQPFYQIVNSSWTASHIERETGKRPPVVYGGINKKMFYPIKTKKIYDVLAYGDKKRLWKGRAEVELLASLHPEWKFAFLADINPSQDKISEIYSQSRIYLSASYFEGWNWPALEAMACGTPVVLSLDGGSADYAKDNYNCLNFLLREKKGIIKAEGGIKRILKDKRLRNKLIKNGLKTVKKFTWEKAVEQFEKHLKLSLL